MNAAERAAEEDAAAPVTLEPARPARSVVSALESPPASANDDVVPLEARPAPVGVVKLELGRPLPLGLPPLADVLDALAGDASVHEDLMALHQRLVALYPPQLLDAVRTQRAGNEDPMGLAAANAWRALVTSHVLDKAFGADQPALQVLVDEAVDAREKVLAAALFSLEGPEGSEPLAEALAEAIERLTERVRFKGAHRRARAAVKPRVGRQQRSLRERFLSLVFVATFFITIGVHLLEFVSARAEDTAWVVVGDVERGHAVLAPARIDADEASLQAARTALRARGLETTLSPTGEWVVTRVPQEE